MAQTQAEVDAIINSLIIDNTTGQINPARMREVLMAINARVPVSSDPSTLTAATPLSINEFTSEISISQADESTPGYLSELDFKKFNSGTSPLPASDFIKVANGYVGGVANDGDSILLNDICISFRSDNTDSIPNAGTFGFFQYVDNAKDDQDPTAYIPVMVALVSVA